MSDSVLNIEIKTKADLAALKATTAQLEGQITAAKRLGREYKTLEDQLRQAQSAADRSAVMSSAKGPAASGIAGVLPTFSKAGGVISEAAGAVGLSTSTLGVGAVAAGIAKSISEFSDAEQQTKKLNTALAQSGQFTVAYSRRLEELASTLQETTGIADETWLGVIARLTQFGATEKDITKHIEAVKNLAGVMGGDLEGAATAVSKAMQGSYDSFRRYGIIVKDAGSQTEKLDELYRGLAARGGGQLNANNETLADSWKSVKNSTNDALEALGRFVSSTGILQSAAKATSAVMYGLGTSISWITDKLTGGYKATDNFKNSSVKTKQVIDEQTESINTASKALAEFETATKRASGEQQKTNEIINAEAQGEERLKSAAKDREIAQVELLEKQKLITVENAIIRKTAIEQKYADDKLRREILLAEQLNRLDEQYVMGQVAKEDELAGRVKSAPPSEKKALTEALDKTRSANLGLVMETDRRMAQRNLGVQYSFAEAGINRQTTATRAVGDLAATTQAAVAPVLNDVRDNGRAFMMAMRILSNQYKLTNRELMMAVNQMSNARNK